jgi:hypothetical protein
MMIHRLTSKVTLAALTVALALGSVAAVRGQQGAGTPPAVIVPIRVDVVLSRYQGQQAASNLPFTLWVNANERESSAPNARLLPTSLQMGVDVPAGTETTTSTTGVVATHPLYRSIGTWINCSAERLNDGRFTLGLDIRDSSVFSVEGDARLVLKAVDPFSVRTFSTSNRITLADGQTAQFSAATDRITSEVLRVEVTVNTVR